MKGEIDQKGLRQFGLIASSVVAGVFGLLLPWLFAHPWSIWPWVLGGLLAAWGLAWPVGLRPVYDSWMRFGHVVGLVNTRLMLGFMFYGMVAPGGLLMRLLGKDPLQRRLDRDVATYRVASRIPPRDHLRRPY